VRCLARVLAGIALRVRV